MAKPILGDDPFKPAGPRSEGTPAAGGSRSAAAEKKRATPTVKRAAEGRATAPKKKSGAPTKSKTAAPTKSKTAAPTKSKAAAPTKDTAAPVKAAAKRATGPGRRAAQPRETVSREQPRREAEPVRVEARPELAADVEPARAPTVASEDKAAARTPPTQTPTPVKAEAPAQPTSPPRNETISGGTDEYGPSIDRKAPVGLHRRIADEVRQLEHQVRAEVQGRLAPASPAPSRPEAEEEPRRLPFEFVLRHWRALAMRDRSDVVDEFGRDPTVAARVDPLLDFFYKSYFRVETRGIGNIPDEGRALIVANHSGTLPYDGAMIMHAVRREHRAHREVRPLVEDFVFHFPYLGTLMNRIGGVRACQENAERLLERDQLVAVFPEGIKGIGKLYAQRYQLQRFGRGGFIKLALATDAPIIPTAVVGAEEIHPMLTKVTWLARSLGIPYIPITPTFPWLGPLGLVPLPTKWYLAFGEPLYFNAEYGAEGAEDRILVNKLAEQVRQRIQEMIDALLKDRRSVILG